MKNKTIDTMLSTLRKHSPNWIDEIRGYINRLEKEIKKLKESRDGWKQLRLTLDELYEKQKQQLSKTIKIEEVEKIIDEFYEAHAGDSKWHIPLRELKQKLTKKNERRN